MSRSLSNLAVIGNNKKSMSNMLSNGMRRKEFSASSTSLTSIPGKLNKYIKIDEKFRITNKFLVLACEEIVYHVYFTRINFK